MNEPPQQTETQSATAGELPQKAWTLSPSEVLEKLDVSPKDGLTPEEVTERRARFGPNTIREARARGIWDILWGQLKNLIVGLLVGAAILSFAFGEWLDGIAIVVVILINTAIGFFMEWRAARSMEALQKLTRVTARVRRGGALQEVEARSLVPGDVVVVEGGDMVSADLRLVEASKLQADESTLTGESVPVGKTVGAVPDEELPLAERENMLFKGTAVTRGSGLGVVVAGGMDTELGRISSLLEEVEQERTPLEGRLDRLGQKLVWVTVGIAVAVITSGILAGKELFLMVQTGVALAVATIPEGLPVVATIALARGMLRMARRNALINRLSAVETLGATNVIFTDKTGTLTENKMTVSRLSLDAGEVTVGDEPGPQGGFLRDGGAVDPSDDPVLRRALETGILCNNASVTAGDAAGERKAVGDPLEVALLEAGAAAGFHRADLLQELPEVREEAFDADVKMMATYHRTDGRYRVAVKGAPEAVLDSCSSVVTGEDEPRPMKDHDREAWLERNRQMAGQGLRVLAVAEKTVDSSDVPPYQDLTFLGLVGLLDPPRAGVAEAVGRCRGAGIRVVMVTGDQPLTARNIARAVGLTDEDEPDVIHSRELPHAHEMTPEQEQRVLRAPIFARVSPEQKLDLVTTYQKNNSIVAMTGDGVNDAPALRKADIGVAMGRRGTQVAREAADMVLKDDAFSSIAAAVEEGRVIFNNIRKFVFFLLSCNVSEIMVVGLASVFHNTLPILPLQILFINLVTDVFPALALGVGAGDPNILDRPPRDPQEPILTGGHWWGIAGYGAVITVAVLSVYAYTLTTAAGTPEQVQSMAVTLAFLTLAAAQLWHVFDMRNAGTHLVFNEVTRNPYVWGALAVCVCLLLGAVYVPGLNHVLEVVDPGPSGWALVVGASLVPVVVGQIAITVAGAMRKAKPAAG